MNATEARDDIVRYDLVVLGAGYAGLMAALRLNRKKLKLRIALINASDQFVERVRLQEGIIAEVTPRIPSLSTFLAGSRIEFIRGHVTSIDADQRRLRIASEAMDRDIFFNEAIFALGTRIDVESVPGAAEHAYRLETSESPRSLAALRAKLRENADQPIRVVTVGGNETSAEVAGEIKTTWPHAEVTMISKARCGGFKGARVESAIRKQLSQLGVKLIDQETVTEVRRTEIVAGSGQIIGFDVCIWSGGLRSPGIAKSAGIATDPQDRIWVDPNMRSISHPHIFAVGDAAHPVAPTGAPYRLSAFAAVCSGAYVADAILMHLAGRRPGPFSFSTFGQGIAIGRGGVGFSSYPDDKQGGWIFVTGGTALKVRNFFVWFLSSVLKLERRMPGFFFWLGRKRVTWAQANEAVKRVQPLQTAQTA
jgi:NADH dehydrogenase FAD-containing subunit